MARGNALLSLKVDTRLGRVVVAKTGPLYQEKCLVPVVQRAGWAPGPVKRGNRKEKILAHSAVLTPDHSGRSELSYRPHYQGFQN